MAQKQQKKILNKVEWFLLAFAISILVMVFLQNRGIHLIETSEDTTILK